MSHLEIKAVCKDPEAVERILQSLKPAEAVQHAGTSMIKDTYFLPGLPDSSVFIKIRTETPFFTDSPGGIRLPGGPLRKPRTGESLPMHDVSLLSSGELIIYDKNRLAGGNFLAKDKLTKLSVLGFQSPEHAQTTVNLLKRSNPVQITVEKKRTLYWVGKTRVHLDEVKGLGRFVELEYKLNNPNDKREVAQGQREIQRLQELLGIRSEDITTEPSYSTMLVHRRKMESPLLAHPLFSGLGEASIRKISRAPKSLLPGDTVVIEKGPVEEPYVYGIVKGKVNVFADKDCTKLLTTKGPGDMIGELAISVTPEIPNADRNAYVRAQGPVEVIKMHQQLWQQLAKNGGPQFPMELLKLHQRASLQDKAYGI